LCAVLAGEKLDVVDQQRVDLLELPLEAVHRLVLQGPHHRAEELLGAQVHHPRARIVGEHRIAGGEHQVGLAQAGAAVQQQRVVAALAGPRRRLERRGATKLVAAALDEVVEGVVAVEMAVERFGRHWASGSGGRGDIRIAGRRGDARQRADLQADLGAAGEVAQQFTDAHQIALAHVFDHERVGRIQHGDVVAAGGLQRFQPRVDVFGREFSFKAFEAAGPGVHRAANFLNGKDEPARGDGHRAMQRAGVSQTITAGGVPHP